MDVFVKDSAYKRVVIETVRSRIFVFLSLIVGFLAGLSLSFSGNEVVAHDDVYVGPSVIERIAKSQQRQTEYIGRLVKAQEEQVKKLNCICGELKNR